MRPPDSEASAVSSAYTEVTCTPPKDCWRAIGSDDYPKIGAKGLLVWHGPKNGCEVSLVITRERRSAEGSSLDGSLDPAVGS